MPRPKILLVNEIDYIRAAMHQFLENEDFEVVSSGTDSEAFGLMVTQDFDVLITALHVLRIEDGRRLANAVRYFQPEALVVAVADSVDVQEAMIAIHIQADVIVKPLDIQALAELVRAKTHWKSSLNVDRVNSVA